MGFSGRIRMVSHVGDFCLQDASGEGYRPAPPDAPVVACDRLGLSSEAAMALGGRESVAFANFISTLDDRYDGRIAVELASAGNTEPLVPYPPITDSLTAGEWNRIAAVNHRVTIEIERD
jgi:hypothetical protein